MWVTKSFTVMMIKFHFDVKTFKSSNSDDQEHHLADVAGPQLLPQQQLSPQRCKTGKSSFVKRWCCQTLRFRMGEKNK